METYRVRRTIETVATANAASESVASSTAADQVREELSGTGAFDEITIDDTEIYEFPAGPFDPHRVTVRVTLAVTVDAADESAASEAGTDAIETTLAGTDLDAVTLVGTGQVEAGAT